jgi:hypothetical protein
LNADDELVAVSFSGTLAAAAIFSATAPPEGGSVASPPLSLPQPVRVASAMAVLTQKALKFFIR